MSFWETLGDVAVNTVAGVVFVATLPVTLPVAVVIDAVDGVKKDAKEEGMREAKTEAEARHAKEMQVLQERLKLAFGKLTSTAQHYQAILAMEAVAISVANCDGNICDSEREHIEMFIHGISKSSLPEEIKEKVSALYEKKPNIREAFELAKSSQLDVEIFDQIIDLVIHADGVKHDAETAFLVAWNSLKVA